MSEHPTSIPPQERSARGGTDADAALDASLRAALTHDPPGFDPKAHYQRIQGRVASARPRGWQDRWPRWLWAFRQAWVPAVSFGLGAACAAVLMVALAPQWLHPAAPIEPLGQAQSEVPAAEVVLQVRFRDDATLSALRAALRAADAQVIGGPGALGIWRIRVPAEAEKHSLRLLAANPIVLEVNPAP